ncbi:MAG TPA: hypothetical protein VF950_24950 [Planctomycetota bacterium]
MSGAYANRFLGTRLCWDVERRVRKIFMDDDQADDYHQEHDREAKARFLAAEPLWEAALANAGVLPFDPFRENVRLDVSRDEDVAEHLELTFATPPAALEKLRTSLRDAASRVEGKDVADFQNPVAAVRWGDRLGLYVGVRMEARPDVAAALRPRLQKALDVLWPIAASKAGDFPALSGKVRDPIRDFNPWGPLQDSQFMRESWGVGSVDVRIAFQPAKADRRIDLAAWFAGVRL